MNSFTREIWAIFLLVTILGGFFQCSRMDYLLYLSPWENHIQNAADWQGAARQNIQREQYLIIYDPADVQSVLARHIVEKIFRDQKKSSQAVPFYQQVAMDSRCQGVVILTSRLNAVKSLSAVERYVEQGGTAVILRNLQSESMPAGLMEKLGVSAIGQELTVSGVRVPGDLYLGLQGFAFDSDNYNCGTTKVALAGDAVTELTAADGTPLIWSHRSGRGRYFVSNVRERDDKNHYGVYTVILSQLNEDYIYPVMNMQLYFIDDFPSPVPEGNFDRIYQETGLRTAEFYRKLWWPEMLNNAEKYHIKYTGMIIETYGDQVKGPFMPLANGEARNNLIVYGRELLKSGGELGIHGYNHQSLALAGYGQERLGYVPWGSEADMEEALRELKRYIEEVYPGYQIYSYVPPSNILSPEGKRAVKKVFPEMKVYASLYNGLSTATEYFQNFKINKDGTYELPRISSGYTPSPEEIWEAYNVINYNGVFSHFVHPDGIFYEESKDLTWALMKKGMSGMLADLNRRFVWLQPATASEGAGRMQAYFDMDYRIERSPQGIEMYVWNFNQPLTFVLRSRKEIASVKGGTAQRVQDNAYILTVEEPEFAIQWAGEEK